MLNQISTPARAALQRIIELIVRARSTDYFSQERVGELESSLESAEFERVAVMYLISESRTLQLRVYFNVGDAVELAGFALGRGSDDTSDEEATDYFREFANVLAGTIKGTLSKADFDFKLSLPFVSTSEAVEPDEMAYLLGVGHYTLRVGLALHDADAARISAKADELNRLADELERNLVSKSKSSDIEYL